MKCAVDLSPQARSFKSLLQLDNVRHEENTRKILILYSKRKNKCMPTGIKNTCIDRATNPKVLFAAIKLTSWNTEKDGKKSMKKMWSIPSCFAAVSHGDVTSWLILFWYHITCYSKWTCTIYNLRKMLIFIQLYTNWGKMYSYKFTQIYYFSQELHWEREWEISKRSRSSETNLLQEDAYQLSSAINLLLIEGKILKKKKHC